MRVGSSWPVLTRVLLLRRGVGWLLTRRCLRHWAVVEHFPILIGILLVYGLLSARPARAPDTAIEASASVTRWVMRIEFNCSLTDASGLRDP